VRRVPRQRRPRRDLVPSRVDVGAPALMPPPCPWIDAPAARHARWAAPPANLPAFRGARPSSSSGVLPHPPAGHARTTASTRGHPARRFRLPVVASEDLRLRSFFSLLRSLLRSPLEPFCCCTVSAHSRAIFAFASAVGLSLTSPTTVCPAEQGRSR
jgi:hypothetical protein